MVAASSSRRNLVVIGMLICQLPIAVFVLQEWAGAEIKAKVSEHLVQTIVGVLGFLAFLVLCRVSGPTLKFSHWLVTLLFVFFLLIGAAASVWTGLQHVIYRGYPLLSAKLVETHQGQQFLNWWHSLGTGSQSLMTVIASGVVGGLFFCSRRTAKYAAFFLVTFLLFLGTALYIGPIMQMVIRSPLMVAAIGLTALFMLNLVISTFRSQSA